MGVRVKRMRTLRIIVVAVAVLCLIVVAVAGYRLAGAAEKPSLGEPIVVRPPSTDATTSAAGYGEPLRRSSTPAPSTRSVTRAPSPRAAPVQPPPVQVAGDEDEDAGDDADGD
jgi:hypothetical protein